VSKAASLAHVYLAYAVAVLVAAVWLYVGPSTDRLWLDALVADVLATLVVFAFSRIHHNSSFYDPYWSVIPPLLALYWWSESRPDVNDARSWLVIGVITVWAVRLTANWVYTWAGLQHEDWRYPMVRERAGRWGLAADLLGIHLLPTLQVFLGMVPVYVAVTRPGRDLWWLDVVAVLVGLGAVAIELAADTQLHRFVRTRQPGEAMTRGLWGWSRHPNYFGEVTFWFALGLFGVAASPSDWWVLIGAVAMLGLFLFASIPMMEKRSLERRPTYQDVIDRVPMLLPRPPRRSAVPEGTS
jgi:steroid 5-alpha reductase family enzyme